MANDSSNETHRFSTYLTVPTDCKRHEFARQAVQRNKVRPCGRVSLLLFRALKVVVNCQNVCAMASEWRLVGEVEHKTLNPKRDHRTPTRALSRRPESGGANTAHPSFQP